MSLQMSDRRLRQLPELPATVLARILQHVPQKQRLAACPLVCRAWASATDMTTVELAADVVQPELPRVQADIDKQSHRLTVLTLSLQQTQQEITDSLLVQLPCKQLLQLSSLRLQGCLPQLQVQDTVAVGRVLLPKLRTLQLSGSTFKDPSSLLQLTQLGSFTELMLSSISIKHDSATVAAEGLGQALQQLLQSMQQLASLSVQHVKLGQGSLSQLPSSLTHLSLDIVSTPGDWESESCLARSTTHLPLLQVFNLKALASTLPCW